MAEIAKNERPAGTMLEILIAEDRARGLSWHKIGQKHEIDPDEAYRMYVAFRERDNTHNEAEYRMLQLERLEKMIDALWDLAIEQKSIDHVKALLPILQEISKLLGLNKQKAVTEIRVIEQKQVTLVMAYLDAVTETLQSKVLQTVTAKGARSAIEENWDVWVADAAERPLQQITSAKIEV